MDENKILMILINMTSIVHIIIAAIIMMMNSFSLRRFAGHCLGADFEGGTQAFATIFLDVGELNYGKSALFKAGLARGFGV